ncbi:MAG: thioredoxin family protein [Acidobacteriota bacterium]
MRTRQAAVVALSIVCWHRLGAQGFLPAPPHHSIEERLASRLLDATAGDRHVLIVFQNPGELSSSRFEEILRMDAEISRIVHDGYYAMTVSMRDAGAAELARRLGAEPAAIPCLAVLDERGTRIALVPAATFAKDGWYDTVPIEAFLSRNVPETVDAEQILAQALGSAAASRRMVFLRIGAPWCGWCHELESMLSEPAIASILDRHFVAARIDVERMRGGTEVSDRFMPAGAGLPWSAVIDPAAEARRAGLAGYPIAKSDVEELLDMLSGGARGRLGQQERATLRREILAHNARRAAERPLH